MEEHSAATVRRGLVVGVVVARRMTLTARGGSGNAEARNGARRRGVLSHFSDGRKFREH